MAGIVIDLSNYKDKTSARVPEGEYLVNVEDIEMGQTKKGDPMLTVYLKIVGGDQDGLNLVDRLTLTERAMFRVVGFLQGFGIKTPKAKINLDPARLLGKKAKVEVKDGEPYNGQVRSEISSYIRIAKSSTVKDAADDLEDTVSDDPTDYDEDEEPVKVEKSKAKREAKKVEEEPETDDGSDIDLDDIDI